MICVFGCQFHLLFLSMTLQGKGAEGRGRQAQLKRRMLMADAEKAVMICQISIEEGQEDDAVAHFGTLIYCLDRLYKAVKKPAKATGEWSRSVHVFL
jgi:nuclear-control-of-ATPase protein 2